ncbi:MAG: MerR family transcriptional regulator [Sphingobacteriia bacterium]|nr:MAG: MerR family transcriptional regulator [Sphingobacteriia bacterium]
MDAELGLIDVPSDEVLKEKLYYPISEVAGWFRVNASLLRYWENEFDVLKPRKTRKGDRLFRAEDIQYLKQIYFLLREKKFSIEGAKAYLKNNKNTGTQATSTRDTLLRLKEFLLALRASLD